MGLDRWKRLPVPDGDNLASRLFHIFGPNFWPAFDKTWQDKDTWNFQIGYSNTDNFLQTSSPKHFQSQASDQTATVGHVIRFGSRQPLRVALMSSLASHLTYFICHKRSEGAASKRKGAVTWISQLFCSCEKEARFSLRSQARVLKTLADVTFMTKRTGKMLKKPQRLQLTRISAPTRDCRSKALKRMLMILSGKASGLSRE